MYGITTKNITNANGIQILKGEKVQCLFITELGNNYYEGLFVTETGVILIGAAPVQAQDKVYGVDTEITEKEIEEYATCTSCKKPSSYLGKMYWFNGKLYCKDCLIQELLKIILEKSDKNLTPVSVTNKPSYLLLPNSVINKHCTFSPFNIFTPFALVIFLVVIPNILSPH